MMNKQNRSRQPWDEHTIPALTLAHLTNGGNSGRGRFKVGDLIGTGNLETEQHGVYQFFANTVDENERDYEVNIRFDLRNPTQPIIAYHLSRKFLLTE